MVQRAMDGKGHLKEKYNDILNLNNGRANLEEEINNKIIWLSN